MYLDKFVHSNTGRMVMSIILGIGFATMFRAVCVGKRCRIIAAPPMEDIDGQIYKFDNKCYKMETNAVKCDKNKKVVII